MTKQVKAWASMGIEDLESSGFAILQMGLNASKALTVKCKGLRRGKLVTEDNPVLLGTGHLGGCQVTGDVLKDGDIATQVNFFSRWA